MAAEQVKWCPRCQRDLPASMFYKRGKAGSGPYCKECTKAYERKRYGSDFRKQQVAARAEAGKQRNRARLWAYLLCHPCVDCGEGDPIVLEFDHLDGREGKCVTTMTCNATSWKRILQEIQLCDVVCANCHARRTAKRGQSWRLFCPRPILSVNRSRAHYVTAAELLELAIPEKGKDLGTCCPQGSRGIRGPVGFAG